MLTHSLTSRPLSMTVSDSRWPLLCFFSTVPCLVTSPSAECSYSQSTLLCRPSIVFWFFLGDVNHLYCPPRLSVPNFPICSFNLLTNEGRKPMETELTMTWHQKPCGHGYARWYGMTQSSTDWHWFPVTRLHSNICDNGSYRQARLLGIHHVGQPATAC